MNAIVESYYAEDLNIKKVDQKGIEHLLLGSVAEKVIRMAPCPVFTVKAVEKSLI